MRWVSCLSLVTSMQVWQDEVAALSVGLCNDKACASPGDCGVISCAGLWVWSVPVQGTVARAVTFTSSYQLKFVTWWPPLNFTLSCQFQFPWPILTYLRSQKGILRAVLLSVVNSGFLIFLVRSFALKGLSIIYQWPWPDLKSSVSVHFVCEDHIHIH